MTPDTITAALDELAAFREELARLDAREAEHHATLTGLLAGLTARPAQDPAREDPGGYCWPPFFLSVKSAPGVVAGEGHLRRGGAGRATTP